MAKPNITTNSCPDCGAAPAPHLLIWWSNVLDWLLGPYTRLIDKIWKRLKPKLAKLPWDGLAFKLMWWLEKFGLGKVVTEIKPDHSTRTRVLWEEAVRRGIEMFEFRPFGRSVELMVARYRGQLFAFDGLPRPHGQPSEGLEWMDDKGLMRYKFLEAGLPVARGGMAKLVQKALVIFDQVGPPVIVKPRFGSRSRHTWIYVQTRDQLVKAFYSAQRLCPWVVVEEQLQGPVHRATVIGGKLIGVARRDMPQIVGDGIHTIGELVADSNNHPGRAGDFFTALPTAAEAADELYRQNLTWNSCPSLGQQVLLGQKVNRGAGGVTVEVTGETHTDNKILFEKIASVVGDSIIGIDFIVRDVAAPWHTQVACGVIECNSLPFIDRD